MTRPLQTKALTALVIAVVFGAGLAVGFAMDRTAVANPAPATSTVTASPADEVEEPRRTPMYEKVGPTEEQKVLLDSIVVEYRERLRAIREASDRAYQSQFQALVGATRLEIKEIFTAEQAARYDSLVAEYERTRAKQRASANEG